MYDNPDAKIVIEHVFTSQRIYHVSCSFDCEIRHMIGTEQELEKIKKLLPQELLDQVESDEVESAELRKLAEHLAAHRRSCRIGTQIENMRFPGLTVDHTSDTLFVNINLAKTNWALAHEAIKQLVTDHFEWESFETEMV